MERILRKPWAIIALAAAITAVLAWQVPRARLDNDVFRFVPEDDPARVASTLVEEEFGGSINLYVGLERPGGVLDAGFLEWLAAFSAKVEAMPSVKSVTSLVNVDAVSGEGGTISVRPLVPEGFSGTDAEIAGVKASLKDWELYRRGLVSDDFGATQVIVSLGADEEDGSLDGAAVQLCRDVLAELRDRPYQGVTHYVAGIPAITSTMNDAMRSDVAALVPLVLAVVAATLFLSFRRLGGVLLPLVTVALSAVWTIGLMAALGFPLSMLSVVLPVILMAVGSAYAIHVTSHFYDEAREAGKLDRDGRIRIVASTLRRVGMPTFLAAATTLAGFASLCVTRIVPIFEFGLFASIGVVAAYTVAMTVLPALLVISGGSGKRREAGAPPRKPSALIAILGRVVAKPAALYAASAIAVAFFGFGATRLVVDNVTVEYFRADSAIAASDAFIREDFAGSKSFSVVVSGEGDGSMTDPRALKAMDDAARWLVEAYPDSVGKVSGFHDVVKRLNQAFNAEEPPEGVAPSGVSSEPVEGIADGAEPAFAFGSGSASTDEPAFAFGSEGTGDALPAEPEAALTPMPVGSEAPLPWDAAPEAALALPWGYDAEALVAQMAKATNYRGAAYYEIPSDPARYGKESVEGLKRMVGNYLALAGGSSSGWIDDPLEPSKARMIVQLKSKGHTETNRIAGELTAFLGARLPEGYSATVAGPALVEKALSDMVVGSQLASLVASLALVFTLLSLYYRSPAAGGLAIIPLGLTMLANFGFMGLAGIKLNIGTAMTASLAVGIGIDYSIHFLSALRHERRKGIGAKEATTAALAGTGKAILFNALAVGAGFAVLLLSNFNLLAWLGELVALTMLVSSVASVTLLPAIVETLDPKFLRVPVEERGRGIAAAELTPADQGLGDTIA